MTGSDWSFLAMGLVRMFAASLYKQVLRGASSMTFMVLEGFLLVAA